ncbi:MAG: DUF393 domain-containing protein [Saprospiraceae bacterium]|nr:DUF393 domain-containing protein [Saprospiraceae bacterium]
MKTEKAIIYDDNCPMCKWYTGAFVQANLLKSANRISFGELNDSPLAEQIEMQRSKHEIPLVDLDGGETIYGVDSLVHLLQPRFPMIGKLMQVPALSYLVRKLYQFISYNRGIMAPSYPTYRKYDCTPDFHLGYRLLLVLLLGGIGSYLVYATLIPYSELKFILLAALGLFVLGIPFGSKHYASYLGHLSVVLFLSGLILLLGKIIPLLAPVFIGVAAAIFLWQFIRRYRILFAQIRWNQVKV